MPSANYIMKNWCVDMTWTPVPGTYAPITRKFKMKAHAGGSAIVAAACASACQDMDAQNPVIRSAPYLDPDQSW